MFYINVMDAWSNVTVVGPFQSEEEAKSYPVPTQFDWYVVTADELEQNFRDYGAVKIKTPE